MSFQDLERGIPDRAPLQRDTGIDPEADLQFKALARTISVQVQKVLANTAAINKFVDLLGGKRDSPTLRKQLHDLTESTREVLKGSTTDVKRLTDWKLLPSDRIHKQEQQKVSADFQRALEAFQDVARRSAERQRLFVERQKVAVERDEGGAVPPNDSSEGQLLELQQTHAPREQQLQDADLDFQEQLIQEREGEIEQIEQGITELNQIFKDLGQIVGEQQSMIDNIETNVISVARDTSGASTQLTQAHAYQRKAGRRMFCLLLVFLLVAAVVLLALLS